MRRLSKSAAPAALAALTLCAAAYWVAEAVVMPHRVRTSLQAGLSPFFPGGFEFDSAVRTGRGRYRLSGFRAFAPGRPFAWLDSPVAEIETGEGGSLAAVTLGSAGFDLDPGPDFIPPGGFRLPETIGKLPRVTARNTDVYYPMPSGAGVRALIINALDLDFSPSGRSGSLTGSFGSVLGSFAVSGNFEPGAKSSIRAVVAGDEAGDRGPASYGIGPLSFSGAPSGALTFVFGGGQSPSVSGSLSYPTAAIAGVDSSFDSVRVILRGQHLSRAGFAADVEAASGRVGLLSIERASVKGTAGLATFSGRATAYGGALTFRGAARPSLYVEGAIEGANLSSMPPGLLGSVTPSAGRMDADFRVKDGAVSGSFRAEDASLWEIPILTGIGRAVSGLGGTGGARFRSVEGSFAASRGGVTIPALRLEGAQTTLELESPGWIGPDRRIRFDFVIRLRGAEPPRRGLPPFDDLARALSHAITDPLTKALCFRMSVTGTLDRPAHGVLPPPVLRKG